MNIYNIENQPLMSQAISLLIRKINPSAKIIEVSAISKLQELMLINGQPDMFIMDPLAMGLNYDAHIRTIKNHYPNTPLIAFSPTPIEEAGKIYKLLGADFYIEKTTSCESITKKLQLLINNNSTQDQNKNNQDRIKLTKRQKQIILLVNDGCSNDEVAQKLQISPHTIKVHLWRLYKKIGINSRTQLIKYAHENDYLL